MGCVYCVTCVVNDKKYIGKTCQTLSKRKTQHLSTAKTWRKSSGMLFHKALMKYGADKFIWETLFESDDEGLLYEQEEYLIIEFNTMIPNGYNTAKGGRGGLAGRVLTGVALENNRKRAENLSISVYCLETDTVYKNATEVEYALNVPRDTVRGRCNSESKRSLDYHVCNATDEAIADLKHKHENGLLKLMKSPEAVEKMRQSQLGKVMSEEFCTKTRERMIVNNPFKGKKHTAESLQKMSENRSGMFLGKDNPSARRVRNMDTGEVFDVMKDIVKHYGLPEKAWTNICSCCRGKLKSAYGYHWQYADEDIVLEGVTQ